MKVPVAARRRKRQGPPARSPRVADEDPRLAPVPLSAVPQHVAEGAARYNAGRFWHAHEAWEIAWHALRAAGKPAEADYVQGLVFVTAAFENLQRGKPVGARRQLAKALARLRALEGRGEALGLRDERGFLAALARAKEQADRPTVRPGEVPAPRLEMA